MRLSKMHIKTLREVPNEAEIASHILLLRTGMIRKLVSGVYGFMPLGWRSVRKIEDIAREEMDATGAQEIYMSAVQPAEPWQESGDGMHMDLSSGDSRTEMAGIFASGLLTRKFSQIL